MIPTPQILEKIVTNIDTLERKDRDVNGDLYEYLLSKVVTAALRIPLGDEGDWAKKVLNYPEDYLMPCFIAVGKASANASNVEKKTLYN